MNSPQPKDNTSSNSRKKFSSTKEATRLRVARWRAKNPDKNKEQNSRATRTHRKNNHEKNRARWQAALLTTQSCVVCGCEEGERHHVDYSKPLEVMWLCRKHHLAWHRLFLAEGA